jgi:hypothetical protein
MCQVDRLTWLASRGQEYCDLRERGWVRIVDRARLEELTCECYQIMRDEYEAMLAGA